MVANSNIASIGRFSSQMLTYLGTQRTVKSSSGDVVNTFKYANGTTFFPDPGNASQSVLGDGVVGNYTSSTYDTTRCYFLSRGAGPLYADTMAGLAIDMATTLGISTQALLEQVDVNGTLSFTEDAYRAMNVFRDPGNQVGTVTTVSNKYSLQSREIRS